MNKDMIRVVAMDLDGTLTQHKTPPDAACKDALERLSKKYKLLMVSFRYLEKSSVCFAKSRTEDISRILGFSPTHILLPATVKFI